MGKRRWALISVSEQEIFEAIKKKYKTIPQNSKPVGTWYDFKTAEFKFKIEHKSFAEVPPGAHIIELERR